MHISFHVGCPTESLMDILKTFGMGAVTIYTEGNNSILLEVTIIGYTKLNVYPDPGVGFSIWLNHRFFFWVTSTEGINKNVMVNESFSV